MPLRHRIAAIALGVLAGLVATAGTVAVVAAGFALSFDAIRAVASSAHIRADIAWMYPVTVDGSMAVATVVAVVLHRMRQPVWYPWLVVIWGVLVSVGCNGLHAYQGGSGALPPAWAVVVSAVPAVNLALSVHLLVTLVEAVARRATVAPTAATTDDSGAPMHATADVPADDSVATPAATAVAATPRQPALPAGDSRDDTTATADTTAPRQPAADPGDTEATPDRAPAASRRDKPATPRRQQSTRERVAAAVARDPDTTPADVAKRLRVHVRTVQRYWPHQEQERTPVLAIAR